LLFPIEVDSVVGNGKGLGTSGRSLCSIGVASHMASHNMAPQVCYAASRAEQLVLPLFVAL
ncbi:hypothetical protein HAX54_038412, partial [Datura stramonium]|nr:hypothetical protein [Datura stramonium]